MAKRNSDKMMDLLMNGSKRVIKTVKIELEFTIDTECPSGPLAAQYADAAKAWFLSNINSSRIAGGAAAKVGVYAANEHEYWDRVLLKK